MSPQQFQRLLNLANLLEQIPEEIDEFLTEAERVLTEYLNASNNANQVETIRQSIEAARQRQELTNILTPPGLGMEDMLGQRTPLPAYRTPRPGIPLPEVELDRGQVPNLVGEDKKKLFKDIEKHLNKKQ